jgi:Flp pilus assembly protein TadG
VTGARRRGQHGQSAVELALALPVVLVVLLVVVQVALLARDRVLAVHVARAVGREVIVDPSAATADAAARRVVGDRARVALGGEVRPGGLAEVTVEVRPVVVPVVGVAVAGVRLRERLVVRVEGG